MMKEFIKKNYQELVKLLAEKRQALRAFHFGIAGSKNRNIREGRQLRRDIARLMTLLEVRKRDPQQ
jgi:ribosomal protein L29